MKLRNLKMKLPCMDQEHNNVHGYHAESSLFITLRLPNLRVMKIFAQALVLTLLIMVFPGLSESLPSNDILEDALNLKSLPMVLDDLDNQGLMITNDKSLIISNDIPIYNNNNIVISPTDTKRQTSVPDNTFDFSFTNYFVGEVRGFIDRTLKCNGIVVVQLSRDPLMAFDTPSNHYKMIYFRRFDDTFVAMQKITSNNGDNNINKTPKKLYQPQRKLLEYFLSEEKKDVLKNLEDVLLEPPRSAKGKSRAYLRKTKFLPDLLNDSLDGYSRRVYIDVGGGHGSTRWFEQNYPTRNKDFDLYRIETVPETETEVETDDAWEGPPTQMGISDWLWRNVKAEEYVVMKAEAEVVEEMLKSKAIVLVDELFLECKPWGKGGKSKRAYWECLALYGRLRDFGVAVHQWWG